MDKQQVLPCQTMISSQINIVNNGLLRTNIVSVFPRTSVFADYDSWAWEFQGEFYWRKAKWTWNLTCKRLWMRMFSFLQNFSPKRRRELPQKRANPLFTRQVNINPKTD